MIQNKYVTVKGYKNGKPILFDAKLLSINESLGTCHILSNKKVYKNVPLKNIKSLNEGILDKLVAKLKGTWEKLKGFIYMFNKNGNIIKAVMPVNAAIAQERGMLNDAIVVVPNEEDVNIANETGIKLNRAETINYLEDKYINAENEDLNSKWRKYRRLNEAKIEFKHHDADVENVDESSMKKFIARSILRPLDSTPLLIWGAPGIGKTQIVKQILKKVTDSKGRLIDLTVSRLMPDDFFLPMIDKETLTATDIAKNWLPVYKVTGDEETDKLANNIANGGTKDKEGSGGVLFFDEITRTNKTVQDICLKLIDERQISGYMLGDKWAIIAASNRPDDDPDAMLEIGTALKNRFMHINFVPSVEDWSDWAKDNLEFPEIADFVQISKEYFYNLDNDASKTVFATPRSWANASKQLAVAEDTAKKMGDRLTPQEKEQIIAANVGKTAAGVFMTFYKLLKTFPPEMIKKVWTDADAIPDKLPFKVVSPDIEAILMAIVNTKDGKRITGKEYAEFAKFLTKLNNYSYASFGIQLLNAKHPYIGLKLQSDYKEGTDIMTNFYDNK